MLKRDKSRRNIQMSILIYNEEDKQ